MGTVLGQSRPQYHRVGAGVRFGDGAVSFAVSGFWGGRRPVRCLAPCNCDPQLFTIPATPQPAPARFNVPADGPLPFPTCSPRQASCCRRGNLGLSVLLSLSLALSSFCFRCRSHSLYLFLVLALSVRFLATLSHIPLRPSRLPLICPIFADAPPNQTSQGRTRIHRTKASHAIE